MRPEKENPLIDESLAAESKQGADDAAGLPSRLARYSRAHHRAVEMSNYVTEQGNDKLSRELHHCGSYLLFRDYYTVGKVRLHAAKFCKRHLLCPLCAIRRGAKMVKAYLDRLEVIRQGDPDLKAYLVTLTVKDGEDLRERFEHLHRSVARLHKTRHGQRQHSEACKAEGAVWSYEFKRGKNSGEWHPHMHAVWLCHEAPDAQQLSAEWRDITGDSFIVDVTPFHDQQDVVTGFLEVFKYALKFSDLPLPDAWHGYQVLAGRRLIASFGAFRGIEVPEEMTDEGLDDLPYIEMLYRYVHEVGYSVVREGERPTYDAPKKPRKTGTKRDITAIRSSSADPDRKPFWTAGIRSQSYLRAKSGGEEGNDDPVGVAGCSKTPILRLDARSSIDEAGTIFPALMTRKKR
ncbi:protein rep [Cupriavidus metallidurans]|jgi:hypothetical protein|uniref:protein rep n=1 Tax=Cupriavidus metallidurans TaxID=119219 RepID=UPI000788D4CE|nr:protein rep [Cupriavidus metallidurans]